jgi:hypothetical protein
MVIGNRRVSRLVLIMALLVTCFITLLATAPAAAATTDSTTTVTNPDNPSVFGQSVTFTATVVSNPAGGGTPTGTVTFTVDSTPQVVTLDGAGQATLTTSALAIGNHTITATYSGDGTFNPSTSTDFTQTVNQAATTATLTSTPDPSVFGESKTLTATVTAVPPGAGTPTGTVDFFDGATLLGTSPLDGSGVATLTTGTLAVGSHALTAVYSGDADFTGSTSPVDTQTVVQAATTATLTSVPDPSVFGEAKTLTATVTAVPPGAGTPTGTISFFDGATLLGTGTLSGGTATMTTSALAVGSHALTAVYGGDPNFAGSTSPVDTQTVAQAGTTTALISAPDPSSFGAAKTLTATVTAAPPGGGIPTGTAAFFDGATLLGTGTLDGSGVATFTTSALAVGSHALTAVYSGDADFTGSTSPVDTQTVDQAATTTALISAPDPSSFGAAKILTATVTAVPPGSGTPTGTVSFFDGATLLGSAPLVGGVGTLTTSALAVGSHALTAVYGGDPNFSGSTSPVDTQTVDQAATVTTLTSVPDPSVFGEAKTLTATVAVVPPGAGTPTGTVSFFDGATLLGTSPLIAGTATLTTSTLSIGSHALTAVYSGDTDFAGSTSPMDTQTVAQAATTTALTSAPDPSVSGEAKLLTATVAVTPPGSGTPTGTVSFFDGATLLGTASLNNGTATFTTSALGVGSHSLTAVYSGDTDFTGSTSPVDTQTVAQAGTTTSVAGAPDPSVFGQAVTLTATVVPVPPGSGTPTGTASFFDGATLLGSGTLSGGVATFTTSTLSVGSHAITAVYSGDSTFTGSTSPVDTLTVNQAATTTTLTGAPNPSALGQAVTLTATVAAVPPGSGTPTGTASFFDGATLLGTGTVSGGVATLTTSTLAIGAHSITAVYSGDAIFTGSTSPVDTQTVAQAATTTALTGAPNPSTTGQSVTFTATVAVVPPGSGTPTGTVTFMEGATTLGTGALNGSGVATLATGALALGDHTITASYGGDTNFASSTSAAFTQHVLAPVTLSLSPLASGALTIPYNQPLAASGGTAPYTYAVTAGSLPPGVTLNASTGLLSGTPSAVGSYTFTVTVTDANHFTGSQSYTIVVAAAPLASITVTPANMTLKAGQTQQYVAIGHYADSTTADISAQVTWSSDATAVASVSASGKATAQSPGTAHVIASLSLGVTKASPQAITGQASVTVTAPTLVGVAPAPAPANRPGGANGSVTAAPAPTGRSGASPVAAPASGPKQATPVAAPSGR